MEYAMKEPYNEFRVFSPKPDKYRAVYGYFLNDEWFPLNWDTALYNTPEEALSGLRKLMK